jgi:DNA-binding response OmpR family regulator
MARRRTILVVDDEESDRSMIIHALRSEGYEVIDAESYRDAMEAYSETAGISFLVADVALPDGNGCALAMALQQQNPQLGVLFVSGHVGGEACRYYGLNVTDAHFLRKPFDPAAVVERVRRVLKSDHPFPDLYVPKTRSSSSS